mmetsp:Transcript_2059/g.5381  ORF Transcript_2059/g.5381 Transcript_2059/m.5381 type:complete len:334 (-) Transcript_2059:64-1065(-)
MPKQEYRLDDIEHRTTHNEEDDDRKREATSVRNLFVKKGIPCLSYTSSSIYMTLAQKYVVTQLKSVKSIFLFYQNAVALLLFFPAYLGWLRRFGIKRYDFWDSSLALEVLPLGVTYSVMLYSSNWALALLTVPMVSVLKNLGPIFITLMESVTDNKPISLPSIVSMAMLLFGSVVAGYHDLKFDLVGYTSMGLNVGANLAHVHLTKRLQKRGRVRKEVSLHYQSIFMCMLLLPLMMYEDLGAILRDLSRQPSDVLFAFVSTGINGIVIALTSMWCIEATSGSTYSMVGALNKIPSSIIGTVLFRDPIDVLNLVGVALGLLGGVCFTAAAIYSL